MSGQQTSGKYPGECTAGPLCYRSGRYHNPSVHRQKHRGSLLSCPSLTVPKCRNTARDFALLVLQSFRDLLAKAALHSIVNPTGVNHAGPQIYFGKKKLLGDIFQLQDIFFFGNVMRFSDGISKQLMWLKSQSREPVTLPAQPALPVSIKQQSPQNGRRGPLLETKASLYKPELQFPHFAFSLQHLAEALKVAMPCRHRCIIFLGFVSTHNNEC